MRILFLNQAPQRSAHYDPAKIEAKLNSYVSPGTKVEIGFPDDYEGSRVFEAIGIRFAEMCVALKMTQSAFTYPRAKLKYEDFVNR